MSHIKKIDLKSGEVRYVAVVEIKNSKRKRKRKTKRFIKKGQAEDWLSDMISSMNKGNYITEDKHISVADFLDKWLKKKKLTIRQTTYDRYKNKINAHLKPELGEYQLQNLKPIHLDDYFTFKRIDGRLDGKEGGLSENTLKKHYVILNSCLNKAVALELIRRNPLARIKAPSPENKEAPVMTAEEGKKLLQAASNDILLHTFLFTLLNSGMRRGEALGLEWDKIDFDNNTLKIKNSVVTTKGGSKHEKKVKNDSSKRTIPISENLVTILKKYKKKQDENKQFFGDDYNTSRDYVFCKPNGERYYPGTYNSKYNEILKKAGLKKDYTLHTLRHSFATILLKKGVSIKVVQNLLGHSTSAVTMDTYSHTDHSMHKDAIDILNDEFVF